VPDPDAGTSITLRNIRFPVILTKVRIYYHSSCG